MNMVKIDTNTINEQINKINNNTKLPIDIDENDNEKYTYITSESIEIRNLKYYAIIIK